MKKLYLNSILKLPFLSLIFSLNLYSSTFNIQKIEKDFYKEVVLKPLISKGYKKSSINKSLKKRAEKFTINKKYWKRAQKYLRTQSKHFSHSQFIALVDLSKQVFILLVFNEKTENFYPIGFDFISSGNINKEISVTHGEDHFLKTPQGLFPIQSGWRSDGKTLDDNITLPYGEKERFVFYFGTQTSIRYNTFDKNGKKIKNPKEWKIIRDKLQFAMHAHKSTTSLGEPHSHGCIRMTSELNLFLDNNLVFFKPLIGKNKKWLHPYNSPPKTPKNYALAGKYMLVIDKI